MSGRWLVETIERSAAEAHALEPAGSIGATIWIVRPSAPALVLGSTQRRDGIDEDAAAALQVEVVHRRSGGGAVYVDAASSVWVDIILPRDDPLWHDDVAIAAHWVGDVWADVAAGVGLAAEVHTGPMLVDALARRACFVGRGPGEVTVSGQKLVGISQRRTRMWVRFQCVFLLRWDWQPLVQLLGGLNSGEIQRVATAGVGSGTSSSLVVDRFLAVMKDR